MTSKVPLTVLIYLIRMGSQDMGDGDGTRGHAGTVNEGTGFDDGGDDHSDGDNVDDDETGMGDDGILGSEGLETAP
jgi:hypothetical protein